LSLLVVISVTTLFWNHAEGKSCYVGQLGKDGKPSDVQTQTCSDDASFGCSHIEQNGIIEFGCVASKKECVEIDESENLDSFCCEADNCNYPE
jgi:hypothetical protein